MKLQHNWKSPKTQRERGREGGREKGEEKDGGRVGGRLLFAQLDSSVLN